MVEKINVSGHYLFEGFDKDGKKILEKEFSNIITNGFFEGVINFLDNANNQDANFLSVTHIALGTGTQMAARGDTNLENETFRKQITAKGRTVNQYIYKLMLAGEEANFNLREVGTFANELLISRANISIDKTSSVQYLITFTITMQ
jgi:hypothetical protein